MHIDHLKTLLAYNGETGWFTWVTVPLRKPFLLGERAGTTSNSTGYRYIKIAQRRYREHHLAWRFEYGGIPEGLELDHINGNRADNRIANLRLVTRAVNLANRVVGPNRQGLRGVSLHRQSGLYRARIAKGTLIGYYDTPEAASEAYEEEALKLYGHRPRVYRQQAGRNR